ncbi:hypothetical protein [Streptomyces sp. NPDC101150]
MVWPAALKAATQHLIEETAATQAQEAYVAGPVYQRRLSELRAGREVETS